MTYELQRISPYHQALQARAIGGALERLEQGEILVGPGPIGDVLDAMGENAFPKPHPGIGGYNALLTSEGRGLTGSIYRSYLLSADFVEAGTWGPSKHQLEEGGYQPDVTALTRRNAQAIAVQEADRLSEEDGVLRPVFSPVRPIFSCYYATPEGVTGAELLEAHLAQARDLEEAGVQAVVLQTFPSIPELVAAKAAFDIVGIKVIAALAYAKDDGRGNIELPGGETFDQFAAVADELGIPIKGASCITPDDALKIAEQHSTGPLMLEVNGLSSDPTDEYFKRLSPQELAKLSRQNEEHFLARVTEIVRLARLRRVGLSIGSCCVTDPTRTASIRDIVERSANQSDEVYGTGVESLLTLRETGRLTV